MLFQAYEYDQHLNMVIDTVGLNKILFTHRNHKLNKQVQETQKQYAYLSVTYIQNDNHTDTYDGKMANYCQNVRGNKTKDQNDNKKQTNKQNKTKTTTTKRAEGQGLKNK